MRNIFVHFLTIAVSSICASCAFSQQLFVEAGLKPAQANVYVLLQGQEIKLPEDFVARLDGTKLKVSLKSLGLTAKNRDRDLLVSLIQDDGTKTDLSPDANGEMTFVNVKQGLASIVVASGQASYAAMAMYAVQGTANAPAQPFEIPVASVDSGQISPEVEAAGTATPGADSRKLSEFPSGLANRFRVYLRYDGILDGHVIIPEAGFEKLAGGVKLSFFRDGSLIANTTSAADGAFSVVGLSPGVHSVFASGPPGHASFAFEVVAPESNELPISTVGMSAEARFVSVTAAPAPPADELIVLMIPPRLMPGVREAVRNSYGPAAGLGANGGVASTGGLSGAGGLSGGGLSSGGGFGGGGGGGFGGGSGLGALLGAAGLATGVAALSNNNSDGFNVNLSTPLVGP